MDEPTPTSTWTCDCGHPMACYRGQGDQDCPCCGQWYNAVGQRLRSDFMRNPSMWGEEIGDLEGFEIAHADDR